MGAEPKAGTGVATGARVAGGGVALAVGVVRDGVAGAGVAGSGVAGPGSIADVAMAAADGVGFVVGTGSAGTPVGSSTNLGKFVAGLGAALAVQAATIKMATPATLNFRQTPLIPLIALS